ncbi:MAG: hypothetical protein GF355_07040 [Candidatus Eisenbacteria bacterium]|nr:hypothetical protein [Candidatus Eisenbacteria bacterium]
MSATATEASEQVQADSEDAALFVIDSREQRPYRLEPSKVAALPTGDYSIAGFEDRIAVERKTKADLYVCIGRERQRFERELERLAGFDFAAIVIECSLPDFLRPPAPSLVHPRAAIGSLLSWAVRHGVHAIFAGDRRHGAAVTKKILEKARKYIIEKGEEGKECDESGPK